MTYRQLLDFLQSSLLQTSLNGPVHLINLFSSVETLTFFTAVGWGSLDLLTPRLLLSGESSNVTVLLVSSVLPGELIYNKYLLFETMKRSFKLYLLAHTVTMELPKHIDKLYPLYIEI